MPSTIEGISEVTASALDSPYCAPWKLTNERNTVGKVNALRLVSTRAKKNSVQTAMNANTAAATIPGKASGTAMRQKACHQLAP